MSPTSALWSLSYENMKPVVGPQGDHEENVAKAWGRPRWLGSVELLHPLQPSAKRPVRAS